MIISCIKSAILLARSLCMNIVTEGSPALQYNLHVHHPSGNRHIREIFHILKISPTPSTFVFVSVGKNLSYHNVCAYVIILICMDVFRHSMADQNLRYHALHVI